LWLAYSLFEEMMSSDNIKLQDFLEIVKNNPSYNLGIKDNKAEVDDSGNITCSFPCRSDNGLTESHRVTITPKGRLHFWNHSIEELEAIIAVELLSLSNKNTNRQHYHQCRYNRRKKEGKDLHKPNKKEKISLAGSSACNCACILYSWRTGLDTGVCLPIILERLHIDNIIFKQSCIRKRWLNKKKANIFSVDINCNLKDINQVLYAYKATDDSVKDFVLRLQDIFNSDFGLKSTTKKHYDNSIDIVFKNKSTGWCLNIKNGFNMGDFHFLTKSGGYQSLFCNPLVVSIRSTNVKTENFLKDTMVGKYRNYFEKPSVYVYKASTSYTSLDLNYIVAAFMSMHNGHCSTDINIKSRKRYVDKVIDLSKKLTTDFNFDKYRGLKIKAKRSGSSYTGIITLNFDMVCSGPKMADYLMNKVYKAYKVLSRLKSIKDSDLLPWERESS